jgi:hypothetical protein
MTRIARIDLKFQFPSAKSVSSTAQVPREFGIPPALRFCAMKNDGRDSTAPSTAATCGTAASSIIATGRSTSGCRAIGARTATPSTTASTTARTKETSWNAVRKFPRQADGFVVREIGGPIDVQTHAIVGSDRFELCLFPIDRAFINR